MGEHLDPGIVEHVRVLNAHGFTTTDSGDGSKEGRVEGAVGWPHVVCVVAPCDLLKEADRCMEVLRQPPFGPGWTVEASYSPHDGIAVLYCAKYPQEDAEEEDAEEEEWADLGVPSRYKIGSWLIYRGWVFVQLNITHEVYSYDKECVSVWCEDNDRNLSTIQEVARIHGMGVQDVLEEMRR